MIAEQQLLISDNKNYVYVNYYIKIIVCKNLTPGVKIYFQNDK